MCHRGGAGVAHSPGKAVGKVLFDDLGNQIKTVFHRRSAGLELLAPVGLGDLVFSKSLLRVHGVGHRRHVRGIHGVHPADEFEDVRKLFGGAGQGLVTHLQACQVGNTRDLVRMDGHGSITC